MRRNLLIIYLTLIIGVCTAQEFKIEIGKVSQEEVDYSMCPFDSTADAVVLFDVGKAEFMMNIDGGFNIRFIRKKKVKIFTEAGMRWANFEIPFYQEGGIYEKVSEIYGATYNYDNGHPSKTVLPKNDWHDETINERWNVRKIAMPNVKPGSIVELTYQFETPYVFNLPDWEFQSAIPTLYSKYEVGMIPWYEYVFLLQGSKKFDEYKSYESKGLERSFAGVPYHDLVYCFVMKDVAAFKDEEMITSVSDYITKIDFQLAKISYPSGAKTDYLSTWPKIIEDLDKRSSFGKFVKKSEKSADDLMDVEHLKKMPPKERFNAVMDFVKKNYNWDGINWRFATKSVKELLQDKQGNSADINLFAVGLLNACEIEAYPVWSSTRNHGKVSVKYPFTHFFNNVLIYANLNGETTISDATEVLLGNNRIPPRCINERGLIINPNSEAAKWVGLECRMASKIQTQFNIQINDGKIDAQVRTAATEYDGFLYRNTYGSDIKTVSEEIRNDGFVVQDSMITIKGFDDFKKPYKISYKASTELESIGFQNASNSASAKTKIYVSPFLDQTQSENPLKQKSRTYPVDLTYPKMRNYISYITIPQGYQLDYFPGNYKIKNDLFEMSYSVLKMEDKLVASMSYYFKKSVYKPEDYEKIKFYFKQIVSKGNDKIVLSQI